MKLHYNSRKYRDLVEWIAYNDNLGDDDPLEIIAGYLTVTMLAHCYNLKNEFVAADVLQFRALAEREAS